jgi:hypothetical protein
MKIEKAIGRIAIATAGTALLMELSFYTDGRLLQHLCLSVTSLLGSTVSTFGVF